MGTRYDVGEVLLDYRGMSVRSQTQMSPCRVWWHTNRPQIDRGSSLLIFISVFQNLYDDILSNILVSNSI